MNRNLIMPAIIYFSPAFPLSVQRCVTQEFSPRVFPQLESWKVDWTWVGERLALSHSRAPWFKGELNLSSGETHHPHPYLPLIPANHFNLFKGACNFLQDRHFLKISTPFFHKCSLAPKIHPDDIFLIKGGFFFSCRIPEARSVSLLLLIMSTDLLVGYKSRLLAPWVILIVTFFPAAPPV